MSGKSEATLALDRMDEFMGIIDDRIKKCKRVMDLSRQGLGSTGQPTKQTSSPVLRSKALRDMQLLCLVRDLINREEVRGGIRLTAPGRAGLERLVFPQEKKGGM